MVREPLRVIWRSVLAAALIFSLSGCYFARAAWEEARILAARKPIERLLNDRSVPDSLRQKLALVRDARTFALSALALKPGDSFTSYADIGRDTLLLVLSAARRDTLAGREWTFPIVGRFPYKGFFDFAAARREAEQLERDGLDVYLRPSDAFSTLGWFNDPLLSTTARRDSIDLAITVFHELTHNTLFVKGRVDFNESFASFVGARAAVEFFRARGSAATARLAEARWEDEQILAAFWRGLASSVDSALRSHPPGERRMAARDSVYLRARGELVNEIGPRLQTIYQRFGERALLNNASILARRVYGRGFDTLEAVYACEGRALSSTIRRVSALVEGPGDPFVSLAAWTQGPQCRGFSADP